MSGNTIAAAGHAWIGCDISLDMLALACGIPTDQMSTLTASFTSARHLIHHRSAAEQQNAPCQQQNSAHARSRTGFNALNHRHAKPSQMPTSARGQGLVLWSDMAQGIPLRKASLDGVVSVSAVQWLCHRPDAEASLRRLFEDLFQCLKPHAKAVLQVYIAGTCMHLSLLASCLHLPAAFCQQNTADLLHILTCTSACLQVPF